jgi:hypothetical protein
MSLRDALTDRFPRLRTVPLPSYVVGGAVRDLILGGDPADVDLALLDPLGAAKTFGRKIITLGGPEHLRAYRVVDGDHVYDFAPLLDGDVDADLARRDFTINAMAVDLATGDLLDPHGGRRDIEGRLVRMIHASNFDDDPLRMLKAVRMAVRFDFRIDSSTLDAIRSRRDAIVSVAAERVTYELSVILGAGSLRHAVRLLRETRLDEPLGLASADLLADDVSLAGALALLVGDPRQYGQRWRWSESLLRDVLVMRRLIEQHDPIALYDAGRSLAMQLPAVLRAIGREPMVIDERIFSVKPLLTGDEIASLTAVPPGPQLGRMKRALVEAEIRGEVTTRDEAERFVRASSSS